MADSDLAVVVELLGAKLDQLLDRTAACERRFLTVANAAAYASLSPESVRRLLATGKLTALRPVRGRVVIDKRELDAVILGATKQPRGGRGAATRDRKIERPGESTMPMATLRPATPARAMRTPVVEPAVGTDCRASCEAGNLPAAVDSEYPGGTDRP